MFKRIVTAAGGIAFLGLAAHSFYTCVALSIDEDAAVRAPVVDTAEHLVEEIDALTIGVDPYAELDLERVSPDTIEVSALDRITTVPVDPGINVELSESSTADRFAIAVWGDSETSPTQHSRIYTESVPFRYYSEVGWVDFYDEGHPYANRFAFYCAVGVVLAVAGVTMLILSDFPFRPTFEPTSKIERKFRRLLKVIATETNKGKGLLSKSAVEKANKLHKQLLAAINGAPLSSQDLDDFLARAAVIRTSLDKLIADSSKAENFPASPRVGKRAQKAERKVRIQELMNRHDALLAEWGDYQLDLEKLIRYPALTDMSVAEVQSMHKAMIQADSLRPRAADEATLDEDAYRQSVVDFEVAWRIALNVAKKQSWSKLTDAERKNLSDAQRLLNLALNEASSPQERQVAYKQMMRLLEGIVVVPNSTLGQIEARVLLELEAAKPVAQDVLHSWMPKQQRDKQVA